MLSQWLRLIHAVHKPGSFLQSGVLGLVFSWLRVPVGKGLRWSILVCSQRLLRT